MTAEPSSYEQKAWADLARPRQRRATSRVASSVNRRVTGVAERVRDTARTRADASPRARRAVDKVVGAGTVVRSKVPDGVSTAGAQGAAVLRGVTEGGARAVSRVATSFLSPKRVVKAHVRAGHSVSVLADLRALDLKLIDAIKPRSLDVAYSAAAALSGGMAGALITGSQVVVPLSGGVAAAPSVSMTAAAFVGDAAAVMGLASAVVGHHALHYGYDPARPEEKIFVLSVVNWGTAFTTGSKATAFADVSRLTQALVRGAPWIQLNNHLVAKVAQSFGKLFGQRLVRQSLGKAVPVAGVAAGSSLNWLTLEKIADAADLAYRRRFLLEKYPQLAEPEALPPLRDEDAADGDDPRIAVLSLLRDAGADVDEETNDGDST